MSGDGEIVSTHGNEMPAGTPRVSVIMPAHNAEEFINVAISSILLQSFPDFELLVVDDFSSDATPQILDQITDQRVRPIRTKEKLGVTRSLNFGLLLARGEFIARLDADDVALPQRLQKQVAFLDGNPDYGLVGSWMQLFGDRNLVSRYPVSDDDIRMTMLFRTPFGHPSVMFRKNWDNGNLGFYDESYVVGQDFDLWERVSQSWKVANLSEILTHYRMHAAQVSSRNHQQRVITDRRVTARQWERINVVPPSGTVGLVGFVRWLATVLRSFPRSSQRRVLGKELARFCTLPLRKHFSQRASQSSLLRHFIGLSDQIHEALPMRAKRSR